MCTVDKFLFCVSLRHFGLFYGYFSLTMQSIAVIFWSFIFFFLIDGGNYWNLIIYVVILIILAIAINITHKFIIGIKIVRSFHFDSAALKFSLQRQHKQMIWFRRCCIIFAVLSCFYLMYASYAFANAKHQLNIDEKRLSKYVTAEFICSIVNAVWSIYSSICVDSLYVEIRDQSFPEDESSEPFKEPPTTNQCELNIEADDTYSYNEAICNK